MFSKLMKFLTSRKTITNSNNGNVLVIALIIITVLTFSVSTIAGMSINLVTNTQTEMENLTEESEAKAKIRLAINFFEDWLKDPTNSVDFDTFDGLYENNPNDIFGVTVTNETGNIEGLDDSGNTVSKAYKFAVTLTNGRIISMYDYVSDVGVTTTQFEPFEYTIGTSGDLVLSSGAYTSDPGYPIKMFGDNIYFSRRAPFVLDGTLNDQELTSNAISREALLTYSEAAQVHYNSDLKYCGDGSCFFLYDDGTPMELNKTSFSDFAPSAPTDQGTAGSVVISDFFGDFNYNDYIMNFVNNEAPSGSRTISASWSTLASDIYDNSDAMTVTQSGPWWKPKYNTNWPNNADFVDITEYVDYVDFRQDFQKEDSSMVYFGNANETFFTYDTNYITSATTTPLHIDGDITIGIDESLIVFGDLYLDMNVDTQDILGEILITGNLYITGGQKDWEGSIMVFGETFIDLNLDKQFRTNGYNSGITFMCKDNIHFISHDENHSNSNLSTIFYMFIYTEESVYIDAVNSRYNFSGVLFARAKGDSQRTTYDDYMMGDGTNPIRGIVINSFYGYVDNSGGFHDGTGSDSHRFRINIMSSDWYADRFENLPTFDSEVIVSTGELDFLTSEFTIE